MTIADAEQELYDRKMAEKQNRITYLSKRPAIPSEAIGAEVDYYYLGQPENVFSGYISFGFWVSWKNRDCYGVDDDQIMYYVDKADFFDLLDPKKADKMEGFVVTKYKFVDIEWE